LPTDLLRCLIDISITISVIGISVAAVLSVLAVHHFSGADPVPSDPGRVLSMACLMAAVTFSVALPVLLRSLFYARGCEAGAYW